MLVDLDLGAASWGVVRGGYGEKSRASRRGEKRGEVYIGGRRRGRVGLVHIYIADPAGLDD